jgi:hypothetical protein
MTVVCVHSVIDRNKWCGPSGQAAGTVHHVKNPTLLCLSSPANQAGRRVGPALYSSVSLVVTELGGGYLSIGLENEGEIRFYKKGKLCLFDARDGKIAILSYSFRQQKKMSKTNTKNKKTLYWSSKCPLGYLICTFHFLLMFLHFSFLLQSLWSSLVLFFILLL